MKSLFKKIIFFTLLCVGSTQLSAMLPDNLEQLLEFDLANSNLAITMFEPELTNPERNFEKRRIIRNMLEIFRENRRLAQESLEMFRRTREINNQTETSVAPNNNPELQQSIQLIGQNQRELQILQRRLENNHTTIKTILGLGVIIGMPTICYKLYKWWIKKSDKKKKSADATLRQAQDERATDREKKLEAKKKAQTKTA